MTHSVYVFLFVLCVCVCVCKYVYVCIHVWKMGKRASASKVESKSVMC